MVPLTAAALALSLASSACAACTVLSVHDGDTLTADCPDGRLHVRLRDIDAPELTQPYSRRATRSLESLCVGHTARLLDRGFDRYGRTLARVQCAGVDASEEQVRRGYAWVLLRYTNEPRLVALESEARHSRRGLWRQRDPVAPWDFRREHRQLKP